MFNALTSFYLLDELDDGEYSIERRILYSAICDLSSEVSAYHDDLLRPDYAAYFYFESTARRHYRTSEHSLYETMRKRAFCEWSPLAVPLPFHDDFPGYDSYLGVKPDPYFKPRYHVSICKYCRHVEEIGVNLKTGSVLGFQKVSICFSCNMKVCDSTAARV